MRMTQVLMAGVASIAVAAGALLAAEPPTGEGRRGGRGRMDGVATYLGLTDEQKAQLADQREKTRPQMQALFEKMRDNHEKLRQALEAPAPDPAAVGAIAIQGHTAAAPDEGAARDAREGASRDAEPGAADEARRARGAAQERAGAQGSGWDGDGHGADALRAAPAGRHGRSGRSRRAGDEPPPQQQ